MTGVDRRAFGKSVLGLGFGGLLLGTAGCASDSSNSDEDESTTLTLAVDLYPGSLNPAKLPSGGPVVQLWQGLFDTLLRSESDGTVVPNAAESYTVNDAKTELTLKIRSGMTFTDGSAVDAEAVKASLEWMKSGPGSDASRLANVTITVPDASTVVLTTPKAKGLLPTFLCLAPGVLSSTAAHSASDIETNPVGSGPYKLDLDATTSGETWTMVRNEDYWNKDAYPYDQLVVRLMPEVTTRINALESGQINAAPVTSQTKDEAKSSGLTVLESHDNWAGLFLGDQEGKVIPALGNLKVRQAINMIFDRDAIVTTLYQGNATATNQIFNEDSDAFLPDMVDYYPYDEAKAKKLMTEAGYANGFAVSLPVIPGLDIATSLIIQQLGKLNITVTQAAIASDQVFNEIFTGKYPIFYFTLDSRSPLWDIVLSVQPDSIWNVNKATDPTLQPLLDKAEVLTGAEAKVNAQAINRFLIEQAWFCPWAMPTNFYAMDENTTATSVLGSVVPYLYSFKPA